jgi:hypothetical protein
MARNFRLSDLWWDDRSIGGRVALWWSRRHNRRLDGRRSYSRKPVTYDRIVVAYSDWLWWALKTLAKIAIGIAGAAALVGCVFLVYVVAS